MKRAAIRLSAAALAAVSFVGWVAEAAAQVHPYPNRGRQTYSTPNSRNECYSAGNPAQCPSVHRPDLPLEQQQYYDRNAVGQNVG